MYRFSDIPPIKSDTIILLDGQKRPTLLACLPGVKSEELSLEKVFDNGFGFRIVLQIDTLEYNDTTPWQQPSTLTDFPKPTVPESKNEYVFSRLPHELHTAYNSPFHEALLLASQLPIPT